MFHYLYRLPLFLNIVVLSLKTILSKQTLQTLSSVCVFNVYKCTFTGVWSLQRVNNLGEKCIQNFHLWRYIVGYTVGNLVLLRRTSGGVKPNFWPYIRRYTSRNEYFEYGYPHSNAFLQFRLKLEHCKPQEAAHHRTICDLINDVKLFPTVYTVANFWHYPIRHQITKSSALEWILYYLSKFFIQFRICERSFRLHIFV